MSAGPIIASVSEVIPAAWKARIARPSPRRRSSGVLAGAIVSAKRDACG